MPTTRRRRAANKAVRGTRPPSPRSAAWLPVAARMVERLLNGELTAEMPLTFAGRPLSGDARVLAVGLGSLGERLRRVCGEVSHVARRVGIDGALGDRVEGAALAGAWREMTDDVNLIADSLTAQLRDIAQVTTAVAAGDLSRKVTVEARGEIAQLKETINTMVEQLRGFAAEVTRVAREVGSEGKLGGQANVQGAKGTWRDLTDNVNVMARNLTTQVRSLVRVVTAVAKGDLSEGLTIEAEGEILDLKHTINAMVQQLRAVAREVTRVAREVGTEGKLGGQAQVPGLAGTWADLTENVNLMAKNLTDQVRGIARVVSAVASGDLSMRLTVDARGEIGALAETINNMTQTLGLFADQVTTVAREVGIDGKLGGQARVPGASGTWRDLTDNVNMLAGNLTQQVRAIAKVTIAVAGGDLSHEIAVDAQGEILALKDAINGMVGKLRTFAREVSRVAREVGTEGRLGGQAEVPGVGGTWKDLTVNVNVMAHNLTNQVRSIGKVVAAVAMGDLNKRVVAEAKGEIAHLADTINAMTDTLRTFADQVTSVAREVGLEGRLGGQAKVPGAAGTWSDLTVNVNQLAGNLTSQVRAIAEVASAVTKGDLTRTIAVEARGEVLALKDTINQMIANLHDTTCAFREQDWLKTNLARFSQMMQGQRTLESLTKLIMSELTPLVNAQYGTFFAAEEEPGGPAEGGGVRLRLLGSYALLCRRAMPERLALGEGLIGQCAAERKPILVTDVPGDYVAIVSSLGRAPPRHLLCLPVLFEGELKGVIELGSFAGFTAVQITFLEQVALSIGVVVNMILASARTEELLVELKGSNRELEERTLELEEKASLLEVKNREIARASASLEEKAEQLSMASKYKSDFLANMSHELRTPLHSLLILARMLADNEEHNLSAEQVRYAETIGAAGEDLLALISQILDLSKIEAGKLDVARERLEVAHLCRVLKDGFAELARQRGLAFRIHVAPGVPEAFITDPQRTSQVLRNLLSNAFKFTTQGTVSLEVSLAAGGGRLAFAVRDTGIGIAPDKLAIIFDAFQQADTSTSRTYGGTGLGLTISRELAGLLGGEIDVDSVVGEGATFTLLLPLAAAAAESPSLGRGEAPPAAGAVLHAGVDAGASRALVGRRALLVDDDARNLFAVAALLERHGMQVATASCGQDALALAAGPAEAGGFDIVLMDLMLPGMDGFTAIRHLQALPAERRVPVVALTADTVAGDRARCLAAGCQDVVIKPVQASSLVASIAQAMSAPGEAGRL